MVSFLKHMLKQDRQLDLGNKLSFCFKCLFIFVVEKETMIQSGRATFVNQIICSSIPCVDREFMEQKAGLEFKTSGLRFCSIHQLFRLSRWSLLTRGRKEPWLGVGVCRLSILVGLTHTPPPQSCESTTLHTDPPPAFLCLRPAVWFVPFRQPGQALLAIRRVRDRTLATSEFIFAHAEIWTRLDCPEWTGPLAQQLAPCSFPS